MGKTGEAALSRIVGSLAANLDLLPGAQSILLLWVPWGWAGGGATGKELAGSPQCFQDGEQGWAAELFLLTVKVGSWEQPARPMGLLAQSCDSAKLLPCEGYPGRLVHLCSECKWQKPCFVHDLHSGRMEPR